MSEKSSWSKLDKQTIYYGIAYRGRQADPVRYEQRQKRIGFWRNNWGLIIALIIITTAIVSLVRGR